MIGHTLGRIEMCFDIGSQHLGCWGQNTTNDKSCTIGHITVG